MLAAASLLRPWEALIGDYPYPRMGKSIPSEGNVVPSATADGSGGIGFDRIASFRFTYVAIFLFVLLYVFSVKGLEQLLGDHFQRTVEVATQVDPVTARVAGCADQDPAR